MALAEVEPGQGAAPRVPSYEDWYRTYFAPLRRRCARQLGDDAAADDVAQEALLRAWQHRDRLDPELGIYPWLCTVAQRLCVDAHRSRDRLVRLSDIADTEDDRPQPGADIETAVDREVVRRAMGTLPARHRHALLLRDVEELPYPEVADRLGVSVGGARILLFRARENLRSRYDALSGSLAGVLAVLRFRVRRAGVRVGDRLAPNEWAAQSAGIAVAPAAALLAITSVLVVGSATETQPTTVVASATAPASAAAEPAPSALPAPTTTTAPPPSQGDSPEAAAAAVAAPAAPDQASPPVALEIAMDHDTARVSGAAPAPGGGDPLPFGAEVARVSNGSDSAVLGTADLIGSGVCSLLAGSCDVPDGGSTAEEAP